jgi:hypothetical protein
MQHAKKTFSRATLGMRAIGSLPLPRPSAAVEITCFVAEFIVLKYHSEKFL